MQQKIFCLLIFVFLVCATGAMAATRAVTDADNQPSVEYPARDMIMEDDGLFSDGELAGRLSVPFAETAVLPGDQPAVAVFYVAPDGDDANPGTGKKPFKTIQKAVAAALAGQCAQQREIIIKEGVYRGGISVKDTNNDGKYFPPLLIRAATNSAGGFADVIIEGSIAVKEAEKSAGLPGVFKLSVAEAEAAVKVNANKKNNFSVWEEDTRIRYKEASDPDVVMLAPGTFKFKNKTVVFHTSDSRDFSEHKIGLANEVTGMAVGRSDVVIRGLQFRHFLRSASSSGVSVDNDRSTVTVEDCRFWNCWRGMNIGNAASNVVVRRCRVDDAGGGIKLYAQGARVEQCMFFRRPGRFEVQEYSQDQTAIQYYHPAGGGITLSNLCVGFWSGIYYKCGKGDTVVEYNTVVGAPGKSKYGIGKTTWRADEQLVFRYNIVTDHTNPLLEGSEIPRNAIIVDNCFWLPGNFEPFKAHMQGLGYAAGNIFENPDFADPQNGDYRIKPGSPAAKMGAVQGPIGAFGIKEKQSFCSIPPVKGAVLKADSAPAKTADSIIPGYEPRKGPPREWHVDPCLGKDGNEGNEASPLESLQLALNRANPGDKVVLRPGIYLGQYVLNHGGKDGADIVIEGYEHGKTIFDSLKMYDRANLTLDNASHVTLNGLDIRGFLQKGVELVKSPDVTITNCVFWNQSMDGRGTRRIGTGLYATDSGGITLNHCLFFGLDNAFEFFNSPGFKITYCTAAACMHSGGRIANSLAGSIFRNNSWTFIGNYHFGIEDNPDSLKTFDSDYNNLALYGNDLYAARTWPDVKFAPGEIIKPPAGDFFANENNKTLFIWVGPSNKYSYYYSLPDWQKKTGKDLHSIYKNPLYVDPEKHDFRLLKGSPNVGAGENGTTIGAFEAPLSNP